MNEVTVGVRDLKARLSEYLRRVKQGQVVIITDHGKAVGRIMPDYSSVRERMQALSRAGIIDWDGRELNRIIQPAINKGKKQASDILIESR